MNKRRLQVLLILPICLLALLAGNRASAQCTLVGTDDNGVTYKVVLPCDFPVYISTGHVADDSANYKAALADFASRNPDAAGSLQAFHGSYIVIAKEILDAMPADRKAAVRANPQYYHIIE